MLQRVQTIFFITALILAALPLFGISLFTIISGNSEFTVDAFELNGNNLTENHYFWILLSAEILTILLTIK